MTTASADITPLTRRAEVLDFLATRRSRPPRLISGPVPDDAALANLITLAARVPDHGKLEPWRFIVLRAPACQRLGDLVLEIGTAEGRDPDKLRKAAAAFHDAGLIVAVIAAPKDHASIPQWEQEMSAGCVCLSLVNAALASGWAASWITGWGARHAGFLAQGLGLDAPETVAGFIHIGTETHTPPERPRPDVETLITWQDA